MLNKACVQLVRSVYPCVSTVLAASRPSVTSYWLCTLDPSSVRVRKLVVCACNGPAPAVAASLAVGHMACTACAPA